MTPASTQYDQTLPTLQADGTPPESRITSAAGCRNLVLQWIHNDNQGRGKKRSKVDGLVQGNLPRRRSELIAEGRSEATNVNWRSAKSFEEQAKAAFYDLFREGETFTTIKLKGRDPETAMEWSGVVNEEFQDLQDKDESWDGVYQNSNRETVRFGAGPLLFADKLDWHLKNVPFRYLQVPEDASSLTGEWECAAVLQDYRPHQLYDYIRNSKSAEDSGWDVTATRQAIINAAPIMEGTANTTMSWEWIQQQLKQDSYSFSSRSKVIQAVHFFAREFPLKGQPEGKISHVIFVLSPGAQGFSQTAPSGAEPFLYKDLRCYDKWTQCIHPMYYAQGEGGTHYGVSGQGVEMYGSLSAQNRLINNACDKALSPKIMFRPTSASGKQKALPVRMGDYQILPDNWDMQQVSVGSMIEDQVVMNREITQMLSANLSSYRQNLESPKSGNPITAKEAGIRANDQARLGKTQLVRYYEQLDWLYEERYRRACNPKLLESDRGGKEALEFQRKCKERGVPVEELLRYRSVKATRVTGQGSPYLRQESLTATLAMVGGRLPEDGLENLTRDLIAAQHGQYLVQRYFPRNQTSRNIQDQMVMAALQVASMKDGVKAVWSPSQNPMVFAQAFLAAGSQALASLQQVPPEGAMEASVNALSFLSLIGPAIAVHLQRLAQDPLRKPAVELLNKQLQDLGAATDKLRAHVEQAMKKQAQEKAQLQQQRAEQDSKAMLDRQKAAAQAQLKQEKFQVDASLKTAKAGQDMQIQRDAHNQRLALDDSKTASEITRENARLQHEMNQESKED